MGNGGRMGKGKGKGSIMSFEIAAFVIIGVVAWMLFVHYLMEGGMR